MLPKIVLHKQNGHSHVPAKKNLLPGDIIRLVHSATASKTRPSHDLLKFASVVRTEKPAALLEQASWQVDAVHASIGEVLAQTQQAFDRGEMADVKASLEAIRAQAAIAARMMTRLVAATEAQGERRLVNLNEVIARTLDIVRPRLGPSVRLARQLEPDLPWVVGNERQLEQALVALLSYPVSGPAASAELGTITVETCRRDGVLRGEDIVRLRIVDDGPGLGPDSETDLDLLLARQIIAEHGGVLTVESPPDGGASFTVELPAV